MTYIFTHIPCSIFRAAGKNYLEENISGQNVMLNEAPQVCLELVSLSIYSTEICINQTKEQINYAICIERSIHLVTIYLSIPKLGYLQKRNQLQIL